MLSARLISGGGVQVAGAEERVKPVIVKQGRRPFGVFLMQFRDSAHDKAPPIRLAFLRELQGVNGTSADDIHALVVSSLVASV